MRDSVAIWRDITEGSDKVGDIPMSRELAVLRVISAIPDYEGIPYSLVAMSLPSLLHPSGIRAKHSPGASRPVPSFTASRVLPPASLPTNVSAASLAGKHRLCPL